MSKDRARQREAREREKAAQAEARAAEAARSARRRERRAVWSRRLAMVTPGGPTGQQTGILARRRRVRLNLLIAVLLMIQVLVWVVRPDWPARLAALVVALLVFPVLAAFVL